MSMKKSNDENDRISDIHTYSIDIENREIFLQEKEETESPGVDYRMLQTFIKNMRILESESTEPIKIHLQTIGGCWYAGMGIYDAIKLSKCKVSIIGYGQICSMGTIIMQSADKRIMMPHCIFMCHYRS